MNDAFIESILLQIARNVRVAKSYLANGAMADARRHTQRATSLLTVLAHARLVRATTPFTSNHQPAR